MKLLRFVIVASLVVVVLRALGPKMGSVCMNMFEAMPDDSPPKRMASDLAAIRAQNDRIIELLENQAAE